MVDTKPVYYSDGQNGPYAVEVPADQADEFAAAVGGSLDPQGPGAQPTAPSSDAERPVAVTIEHAPDVAPEAADKGVTPTTAGSSSTEPAK